MTSDENSAATVQTRFQRLWSGWVRPLIVVLVVVSTFRTAVADWHDVPTQSMEPTILVGDRIVVNKLAYDLKVPFTTWHIAAWGDPQRGDIVTFYSPTDGKRLVKRVIGVPGDVVEMRNNRLTINNQPLTYVLQTAPPATAIDLSDPPPLGFALESIGTKTHSMMFQPRRAARRRFAAMTVPPEHYLVLGDNRDNSGDSRAFGFVQRQQILGRVFAVGISVDKDNWYAPRWPRFFSGLE